VDTHHALTTQVGLAVGGNGCGVFLLFAHNSARRGAAFEDSVFKRLPLPYAGTIGIGDAVDCDEVAITCATINLLTVILAVVLG
jgi:hypothetical protein